MRPLVVGIAGGSGSGKTSLIQLIRSRVGADKVTIISQDDYYHPIDQQVTDENGEINFDLPNSIDSQRLSKHINELIKGRTLSIQRYTFNNESDSSKEILLKPNPIILVEGLFVFHYSHVHDLFDMTVFVEAHVKTRLQRRLIRDRTERGYKEDVVIYQWENHVEPAYKSYLLPFRDKVDFTVDNEVDMSTDIQEIISIIQKEVDSRPLL